MVRAILEFLALCTIALLAVTWVGTRKDRNNQKARAERYVVDLEEAIAQVRGLEDSVRIKDSVSAVQDSIIKAERIEAEKELNELEVESDSLLQIALAQVPDSVKQVVQQLHNSYQNQLTNKDKIIKGLELQVALRDTRILVRDSLIQSLQVSLDKAQDLAAFWEKEAKPNFVVRFRKNLGIILPTIAVTAGVTYVTTSK